MAPISPAGELFEALPAARHSSNGIRDKVGRLDRSPDRPAVGQGQFRDRAGRYLGNQGDRPPEAHSGPIACGIELLDLEAPDVAGAALRPATVQGDGVGPEGNEDGT